ncbi:hypothetical protein OE88DRAFT_1729287 [Heliocybe sulcata]|uniref:Uncharacterized protein n=1 Tax=Heliocybe sulcata TaxID=5364 RepID=A0A5C3ML80_9AGAM|nr:hypothetical protein OE88DRAFT_1729287 [Heliocybe sulcata]
MTSGYAPLLSLTILTLCIVSARSAPVHTRTSIVCVEASWRDLCLFFLTNYLAHAATTLSTPGGRFLDSIAWRLVAVLVPFASLGRSIEALWRWMIARGWTDGLHAAWGRGALIVVARTSTWRPGDASSQDGVLAKLPDTWSTYNYTSNHPPSSYETAKVVVEDAAAVSVDTHQIKYRDIHGKIDSLPEGYGLAFFEVKTVLQSLLTSDAAPTASQTTAAGTESGEGRNPLPSWIGLLSLNKTSRTVADRLVPDRPRGVGEVTKALELVYGDQRNADIRLSHTRNWIGMLISLVQLFASALTLYRTRGDQVVRYGYAAFGLSVIPFMLMTIANLVFNAILGEYTHLYVLRTGVLEESERRLQGKAWYEGCVGHRTDIAARGSTAVRVAMHLQAGDEEGDEVLVVKVDNVEKRFKFIGPLSSDAADHEFRVHAIANGRSSSAILERSDDGPDGDEKDRDDQETSRGGQATDGGLHLAWLTVPMVLLVLALSLPYIMIYSISHFENGGSTHSERAWMMVWLVLGQLYGLSAHFYRPEMGKDGDMFFLGLDLQLLSVFLILAPSAIGDRLLGPPEARTRSQLCTEGVEVAKTWDCPDATGFLAKQCKVSVQEATERPTSTDKVDRSQFRT